jgi:hypothetical protein
VPWTVTLALLGYKFRIGRGTGKSRHQNGKQSQPIRAAAAKALVQPSIRNRFITKMLNFLSKMQYAALDISDHRIIGRAMQQSASDLLFEHLLPPFKIKNMVWFRHNSL